MKGIWFEIIRYITPYGKACSHKLVLRPIICRLLNGKVTFKIVGLDADYYYALCVTFKCRKPSS